MIELMGNTKQLQTSPGWIQPMTIRFEGGWFKNIILSTAYSVIAILLFAIPASAANAVNFPGKTSEIKSPDGLYTIKNVDQPYKGGEIPRHVLLFLRKGQNSGIEILNYLRNVDVLWSPDSTSFVVNYWFGSNGASASLYRVNDLKHPIEIGDRLSKALSKNEDKLNISKIDHFYLFANKCINANQLEIKEAGHGESGPGATVYVVLDLQRNSCKVIKRVAKEDTSTSF
jgi:hypothetical protein